MQQIFLAAAHHHSSPLPSLVAELRAIEKILRPLQQQNRLQFTSNRATNIEDVFNIFTQNKNISIFHYAGHANGEQLYLEEKGNIKGIAALFGLNKKTTDLWSPLRFVFLNGCATKGQVSSLHEVGVQVIIATNVEIEDKIAFLFASTFYETWTVEGKTLIEAFEVAKARVKTEKQASLVTSNRVFGFENAKDYTEHIPWGIYFNPQLENTEVVKNWILNEKPRLPKMLLHAVKPVVSQSLRELVYTFVRTDREAGKMVRRQRKDPLMVLIERLPWIVGTHLRRLFAVDADQAMVKPSRERLKELIEAYSSLSQFISYLVLSILWNSKRKHRNLYPEKDFHVLPFSIIPTKEECVSVDYIFKLKVYCEALRQIKDSTTDSLDLLPKIEAFIQKVEDENDLRQPYLIMENWKQAMATGEERLEALIQLRAEENQGGLKQLVLEAETIFARFLHATLFLTQYKLHTIRSITVNKLHNLEEERPYSHYTIPLHAASGQLETLMAERESATDNYCLLLTKRGETEDVLADAVNLSPFYLDRSSYIGNNTKSYPAIFALAYREGLDSESSYVFQYIDRDINHNYTFTGEHHLVVDQFGAMFSEHLETDYESMRRFEWIFQQLQQLEFDISPPKP